jgi:anthranilate phosphoribosyltransferase
MKGETVDEITGAARVLRKKCTPVPVTDQTAAMVDTCGTGGDGSGTFNVSTTAAFVVAGCGIKVAKHGNRSVSSRCGSADLIEALGVNLDLSPEETGLLIDQVGIGFLFAPLLHPAMRHAVMPRREIGLKSVFNILGPLTNPARASVQVIGVYRRDLTETMARVLNRLGCQSAYVVFGEDGLDEISISGPSRVSRLSEGQIITTPITPEAVGLARAKPEEVMGGDAVVNAEITRAVLTGQKSACRDMVLMNAAAALTAAGAARDLADGVDLAAEAIDSGRAVAKLKTLIEASHDLGGRPKAMGE